MSSGPACVARSDALFVGIFGPDQQKKPKKALSTRENARQANARRPVIRVGTAGSLGRERGFNR